MFVQWRPVALTPDLASLPPESHSSLIWSFLTSGWPLMFVQIPYLNDGKTLTVFLSGEYGQYFSTFEMPETTRSKNSEVNAVDYLRARPLSVTPFPGCRHGAVDPLLASNTFVPRCTQVALKSIDNQRLKADLQAIRSGNVSSTLQFLTYGGIYYAAFISRDMDAISIVRILPNEFQEMCYLKSDIRIVLR
jgi:hypothetical protein